MDIDLNHSDKEQALIEDLRRFGDRTSSFMTLFPGFKSFAPTDGASGRVRYMETSRAWVAGTEPLAAPEAKAELFFEFGKEAARKGKQPIMTPVTDSLSKALIAQGCERIQIGAEPLFDLERYFEEKDPLEQFPHARSLLKRGARVQELNAADCDDAIRAQLKALLESWLKSRATVPLSFLNQIDPWAFGEHRRLFVVQFQGKPAAFLSAVPIFPRNAYFFADYIRDSASRPGTVELLFIEAMRSLRASGTREIRLGMCPLARLDLATAAGNRQRALLRAMRWMYAHARFPLNFASIHDFKAKFRPTSWEPLFLVTRSKLTVSALIEASRVHFPESITHAYLSAIARRMARFARADATLLPVPRSLRELLGRVRYTLAFSSIFTVLHVGRNTTPGLQALYERFGFSPADYTIAGHLLGPFFHNTHYHFAGDVSTYIVFVGALELLVGARASLLVVAAGLWLSNPSAWAVVESTVRHVSSSAYARFLTETDYGSSNAIYAAVGALGALIRRPAWLIAPFAANGLFLCLAQQSWLALHHLTALAMGFALLRHWILKSYKKRPSKAPITASTSE